MAGNRTEAKSTVLNITARELLAKETLLALYALAFLILLATLFTPGIGNDAAEHISAGQWQAPWIFASIQELLRFVPPFWGGVFLPAMTLLFWALLPIWDRRSDLQALFVPVGWRGGCFSLLISIIIIMGLTIKNIYF